MEKRVIKFSPPDITEAEISEVVEALRSGWITTGPRTKLLERRLAAYIETGKNDVDVDQDPDRWSNRVVCLNSATAAEELNLRILGVTEGDEVLVPSYTYSASASAAIHCGATVKFVDIVKDGDPVTHMPEMDYDKLSEMITEKTKAVVCVDLAGIVCDYEKIYAVIRNHKTAFLARFLEHVIKPVRIGLNRTYTHDRLLCGIGYLGKFLIKLLIIVNGELHHTHCLFDLFFGKRGKFAQIDHRIGCYEHILGIDLLFERLVWKDNLRSRFFFLFVFLKITAHDRCQRKERNARNKAENKRRYS